MNSSFNHVLVRKYNTNKKNRNKHAYLKQTLKKRNKTKIMKIRQNHATVVLYINLLNSVCGPWIFRKKQGGNICGFRPTFKTSLH